MIIEQDSLFSKFKYLSYFIARAFIIAIISLLCLFGVFLLVYFGDLFINVKSGNKNSPLFNGYVIVSPSMVPTININDAIVVKREKDDQYSIGDIISFFSTEYSANGMVITHRIIEKNNRSSIRSLYTTKGDNNNIPDKQGVYTDDIYGKVLFVIPKLGYVQSFLVKPINLICFIILPVLIVIVYDFMRVGILFKKNKDWDYNYK